MVNILLIVSCSDGIYEGCMYGKHHHYPFAWENTWRAKEKLELVHLDVVGPLLNPTISGAHYTLVFVDNLTKKTLVYFLKNKSDIFNHFYDWEAMVENESDKKIKSLRSDNGKEYGNYMFNQFYHNHGIK